MHLKQGRLINNINCKELAFENTKVIIVRHNPELESYTLAKIGNVQYDIASISPDETNKAVAYDYVTLKRSE